MYCSCSSGQMLLNHASAQVPAMRLAKAREPPLALLLHAVDDINPALT